MIEKIALLVLLIVVSGCQEKETIQSAARDAGMKPTEFIAFMDTGPTGIKIAQREFEGYIKDWHERVDSGKWTEMIKDGSYKSMFDKYDGPPEDYPTHRVQQWKVAIKKLDAVLAYLDRHPELLEPGR